MTRMKSKTELSSSQFQRGKIPKNKIISWFPRWQTREKKSFSRVLEGTSPSSTLSSSFDSGWLRRWSMGQSKTGPAISRRNSAGWAIVQSCPTARCLITWNCAISARKSWLAISSALSSIARRLSTRTTGKSWLLQTPWTTVRRQSTTWWRN